MSKHSAPRHGIPKGEKSTQGGSNGSPDRDPNHKGKHQKEEGIAGSDLPRRGEGINYDNTKKVQRREGK